MSRDTSSPSKPHRATPAHARRQLLRTIDPASATFDPDDPLIKKDIASLIAQYLESEGYTASTLTLRDEANVKVSESSTRQVRGRRLAASVRSGEWDQAEKLCSKHTLRSYKRFMYLLLRHQYLEMIDAHQFQRAFTFLNKRLKPFESRTDAREFADLCYLLTCKSVQEADTFRDWQGAASARDELVAQLESLLEAEQHVAVPGAKPVRENRLVELLQQAIAYQIEFGRHRLHLRPRVRSLMHDYECLVLPNSLAHTLAGHQANVKCVEFLAGRSPLDRNHTLLLSGSSDYTVRVWDVDAGVCRGRLEGHRSRVWDISSDRVGKVVATASGDGTARVWSSDGMWDLVGKDHADEAVLRSVGVLEGHSSDVYSVSTHPSGSHVVTAGYDKTLQLFDVERQTSVRTLSGHTGSVLSCSFNYFGNLVVSGSKDRTIRFWDVVSGACVRTISAQGDVTAVSLDDRGVNLLASTKDNRNKLWDVRTSRLAKSYKGHLNTSKNFVRAGFGPQQLTVVGGSEDGTVHVWDLESTEVVQQLSGHRDVVFEAKWSRDASVLATCSSDTTVRVWDFKEAGDEPPDAS